MRHFQYNTTQSGGFSLIELLLIIAIVGTLTYIGVVSYVDHRKTILVQSAAQTLVFELQRTHSDALSGRGGQAQSMFFASSSYARFGGATYDPDGDDVSHTYLDGGLVVSTSISGDEIITFERLTGQTADMATITVALAEDHARYVQVVVGARGDVTLIGE